MSTDPRLSAMQDAAQQWWDEFCIDTGDHPDFIWSENHNGHRLTFAGFTQADAVPFFEAALAAADRVVPPQPARVIGAVRCEHCGHNQEVDLPVETGTTP